MVSLSRPVYIFIVQNTLIFVINNRYLCLDVSWNTVTCCFHLNFYLCKIRKINVSMSENFITGSITFLFLFQAGRIRPFLFFFYFGPGPGLHILFTSGRAEIAAMRAEPWPKISDQD